MNPGDIGSDRTSAPKTQSSVFSSAIVFRIYYELKRYLGGFRTRISYRVLRYYFLTKLNAPSYKFYALYNCLIKKKIKNKQIATIFKCHNTVTNYTLMYESSEYLLVTYRIAYCNLLKPDAVDVQSIF